MVCFTGIYRDTIKNLELVLQKSGLAGLCYVSGIKASGNKTELATAIVQQVMPQDHLSTTSVRDFGHVNRVSNGASSFFSKRKYHNKKRKSTFNAIDSELFSSSDFGEETSFQRKKSASRKHASSFFATSRPEPCRTKFCNNKAFPCLSEMTFTRFSEEILKGKFHDVLCFSLSL